MFDPLVNLSAADLDDIRLARELLASGVAVELREAARLSGSELASAAGASADAVALWEAGKRTPRTAAALRLGKLYRELQRTAQPA